MRRSLCVSLIVLVGLCVAPASEAQTLLRWKLQPNQKLLVNFSQQMKMDSALAGQQMHSEADLGIDLLWQVLETGPEGKTDVQQTIERVQLGMTSPGYEPVTYDSSDPQASNQVTQTIGRMVQPLLGLGFIQSMDQRGQIHEVRLADEALAAKAAAGAQLNQAFSKDGLRDLLSQAAATLPESAVKVGDQWTSESTTDSPVGKLLMDITYTYRGPQVYQDKAVERIDVAVDMRFDKGPNAMQMEVAIAEQSCSGTVYFDNQLGRLVHSSIARRVVTETKITDQVHRHVIDTKMQLDVRDGANVKLARQPQPLSR